MACLSAVLHGSNRRTNPKICGRCVVWYGITYSVTDVYPLWNMTLTALLERSPLSSGIKKNIIGSIKEAIDYAKIAASEFVTEDEAKTLKIPAGTCLKNEDCKAMLKYILGDDYNEKINDVKST